MMKKPAIWKKFGKLANNCLFPDGMDWEEGKPVLWEDAFQEFQNVFERLKTEKKAPETLEKLEDQTDWKYDFTEWFMEYLDHLDMENQAEKALSVIEYLKGIFDWSDGDELDLDYLKTQSLWKLGRTQEAVDYSREWLRKEPDNTQAAVAYVRACIQAGQYEEAKKCVVKRIPEGTACNGENDVLFMAAIELADHLKDRKWKKQLEKEEKKCTDMIDRLFSEDDGPNFDDYEDPDEEGNLTGFEDFLPFGERGKASGLNEKTAKTSHDFMELARNAQDDAQALKYVKKALGCDPYDFDAVYMMHDLTTQTWHELAQELEKEIGKAKRYMEGEGYMTEDYIGHFWGFVETRPYMRLRYHYFEILAGLGMYRKAIEEGEDILRLNRNDNMGVRFSLCHLFAMLEDEENALKLWDRFENHDSSHFILALAVLYYKQRKFEQSKEMLERLQKYNKDTKKFLKAIEEKRLEEHIAAMHEGMYRAVSIEELINAVIENDYLYKSVPGFFHWAYEILRGKKRK